LASKERRSPRPCQTLFPSLFPSIVTPLPCQPPVTVRHPCRPPSTTPPRSDSTQPPHAHPEHRHDRQGRPTLAARHRPPPALSPRHQPSVGPLDQFPGLVWPEPYRAVHPNLARLTPPSRPERLERAACSSAPATRLAPLHTQAGTASSPRRHTTLARHCHAPTCPHRTSFHPQPL
jgi:hypothetical protein